MLNNFSKEIPTVRRHPGRPFDPSLTTHPEVWGVGFRGAAPSIHVLVRGIRVSTNFPYFCLYGSSEWASVVKPTRTRLIAR